MNKKYRSIKNKSRINEIVFLHIKENFNYYVVFFILFIVGVIIGTFYLNNISDNGKEEITAYLINSINLLKQSELSNFELLKISIKNNLFIGTILWFLGSTIIGIFLSFTLIGFLGFCFGYTASSIIASYGILKGTLFLTSTLFIQNLIFIPKLIALGVSGARFCKSMLNKTKRTSIKEEFIRHTFFCLIMLVFLTLSTFIEIFISKNILNFLIKYF